MPDLIEGTKVIITVANEVHCFEKGSEGVITGSKWDDDTYAVRAIDPNDNQPTVQLLDVNEFKVK